MIRVPSAAAAQAQAQARPPVHYGHGELHFVWLVITLLCLAGGFFAGVRYRSYSLSEMRAYPATCLRVMDGDTFEIAWIWGTNKVRLAGIDAPESKDNKKLKDQAKQLGVDVGSLLQLSLLIKSQADTMLPGRSIKLVFPEKEIQRDAFGRLLAYVEIGDKDFGAMLLRNGLVYPRPEKHPRMAKYQEINDQARENKKGIYGMQRETR
ncbi:MAG: thermonuclease family protein [Lentisphaerota bacterium]